MIDFIFYYFFVGLTLNIILGAYVTMKGYALDMAQVALSVLVWPVALIATVAALLRKEK